MNIKISQLVENTGQIEGVPKNPRLIKGKKYEDLKQSLLDDPEFTKLNPILVYDNKSEYIVMGGNMRLKAANELGWDELESSVMPHNTPVEVIRARIIKHNADYGEDDWDSLSNEWSDYPLDKWGLDTPSGFSNDEVEEDEAPEVEDIAISKLGDIYQLGRHRLMCANCTDPSNVEELLNGSNADMVFTDPPYNVNWQYRGTKSNKGKPVFNDSLKENEWDEFVDAFTGTMLSNLKDGGVYYECSGYHSLAKFEKHLKAHDAPPRQMIVWAKNQFVMGKFATDYHRQHECIWYGWKSKNHQWYGGHKQSDLWQIDKVHNNSMVHSTEKPIAMPAKAIKNSSKEGDIILDIFAGSGSTLIAAEQLNRDSRLIELDPAYCDVIRKRYWKFINNGNEDGWLEATPVITEGAPR